MAERGGGSKDAEMMPALGPCVSMLSGRVETPALLPISVLGKFELQIIVSSRRGVEELKKL